MAHEPWFPTGNLRRGRRSITAPGTAALLALAVTFAPASLWALEIEPDFGLEPVTEAPSNFRSLGDQSRDVGLRPEEPLPADPRKKDTGQPVDMSRERLDPFYRPPVERPSTDAEMEPEEPEAALDPERELERERDLVDEMARTPQVDDAALFRSSIFPRDIVDAPSGGLASGLMRLTEEAALIGKPWSFNYGVFASAMFDDNINLSSTDKQSDVLLTGGLNLAAQLGSGETRFFLSGVYGINYGGYLSGSSESVLGQSLGLGLTYRFSKLTLGLNLAGSYGAGGTVDTAERTNTGTYSSNFTASYAYSDKLSFSVNASGGGTGYENLISSNEYRLNAFIDYTFSPKITVGVGGGYGQMQAEGGDPQTSEQVLVRASYTATAKLSVNGNFGLEITETEGGSNSTPIFGIGAAYQPFERTTFTMNLSRQIYTSAVLAGQDYTATSIALGAGQQLLPRLGLTLSVGYQFSEYFGAEEGVEASRTDKYLFARAAADWQVARWCSMGVFYEFSDSESTGEGSRPFSRNRIGIQVSFTF